MDDEDDANHEVNIFDLMHDFGDDDDYTDHGNDFYDFNEDENETD